MKARNENGIIVLYNTLPTNYKNYIGFDSFDTTIHNQEGFYDVVYPVIDEDLQTFGELFWDDINKVFYYAVIDLTLPTLEEAKLQKITEIKHAVKDLYNSIQWHLELLRNDGEPIPTIVKTKIRTIRTKYEAAKAQINSYTDVVDVIRWKVPYDQIAAIKDDLESII